MNDCEVDNIVIGTGTNNDPVYIIVVVCIIPDLIN